MKRLVLAVLAIVFVAVVYLPAQAGAQFLIPGAESALSVSFSPQYPAPDSNVTLTLQSSLYDLDSSSVTWTVNGKEATSGDAATPVNVKTGPLGSKTDVRADITGPNGSASATATIIPSSVDLLWESDSYVPPFYSGRALPSAGSRVRLVALTHFVRPGGGEIPADQIVFTWTKDSEVLGDSSGRGKSSITVDGPTLFGTETIVVEAASLDGSIAGQALIRIPDTEPKLTLYENHPLFGVLYHQALGATTFVPKNEMSFTAVPYFASAVSSGDVGLQYEWRVNQSPITTSPTHGNEITVNAASSTGLMALINLSLTHVSNYFLSAAGSWSVTFNKSGGPAGGDVFHQ
ncbi:hypothetical protein A3C20_03785 [Candidatus Kaiserbacteria bacterium RIFCSPHIGHO2_02_FULL_55_25]|uniref:Uncharacterized protein n=1 Tax=Candidatus Kaiserbacteria bacterium RIFCSPHIGHO2_02_FULL_55_25 TaxID=1798498 RepID=A0A1F6E7C8_9BACT|nr:MAG: hypothetical protein A2764_04050 [Candidatus Kaiserbacteria bacterium RIFCSPHIGHO2_01_FULL_55_79]OGG69615.1 MAG: hypothetical protein A3C20_03785 [Candidatus Kaiserbacteria bacterium RIFCSPHIGHO2_02_FULL_55_25]OGG76964.1 MAG: hypothetical protein A3F56_02430 [Candidatus Kaiserbacteria bacterium RIFCSPHIGHO2_12_FULL_55_13]OGG83274.1 MAG: hypothetical protein A3A42_01700 [Candidatus Kaiserbacteria bacterium RIFCSPLOWO2_01_FULL_55_25]